MRDQGASRVAAEPELLGKKLLALRARDVPEGREGLRKRGRDGGGGGVRGIPRERAAPRLVLLQNRADHGGLADDVAPRAGGGGCISACSRERFFRSGCRCNISLEGVQYTLVVWAVFWPAASRGGSEKQVIGMGLASARLRPGA